MDSFCDTNSISSETEESFDVDHENIRFIQLIKQYPAGFIKCHSPNAKAVREKTLEAVANAYSGIFGKVLTGKQVQKKVSNLKTRLKAKAELKRNGTKKIVLRQHEKLFLSFLRHDDSPSSKRICNEFLSDDDGDVDKDVVQSVHLQNMPSASNTSTTDSAESQESLDNLMKLTPTKCDNTTIEELPKQFYEVQRTPIAVPIPLVENLVPVKVQKPEIPRKDIYSYYLSDTQENFEFNRVLLFEEF